MPMIVMPELQPSDGFKWAQATFGAVLVCEPLDEAAMHFFTVRPLELRDDEREWRRVAEALGVAPDRLRLIRQVHGAAVAIARAGDDRPWTRPEADVVISDDRESAVGVRVADCAPVLIADSRRRAVAAAHAGWRGTAHGAAAAAVSALRETFGSEPGDLIAAIGPCLGPCCGEVGLEVVDAFRSGGHSPADIDRWFAPGAPGKAQLDLAGANRDQLRNAGVPADCIFTAGLCTKTHAAHLHSYRAAGGRAGRMLGVIVPG
jgi:YfiH family protein